MKNIEVKVNGSVNVNEGINKAALYAIFAMTNTVTPNALGDTMIQTSYDRKNRTVRINTALCDTVTVTCCEDPHEVEVSAEALALLAASFVKGSIEADTDWNAVVAGLPEGARIKIRATGNGIRISERLAFRAL